jgi:hypothetical protein
MNIILILVSGFDTLNLEMNKIRKKQCKKYNIPLFILFNGPKPDDYELDEYERWLPQEGAIPWMFIKFRLCLREIYDRGLNPDYIIRATAATFINFKKLPYFLAVLPKERLLTGTMFVKQQGICNYWNDGKDGRLFITGTAMTFSGDVAKRIAYDDNIINKNVLESDDVCISFLASEYADIRDSNLFFKHYTNFTDIPEESVLLDVHLLKPHKVFYRIRNDSNREKIDLHIWRWLHSHIDT